MALLSSIFLILSLVLAVTIGPQTRPWTWGFPMIAIALSLCSSVPAILSNRKVNMDRNVVICGLFVAAWFGCRALFSPVKELGMADLVLLIGAVGSFISIKAIEGHVLSERIFAWGIALLLAANCYVIAQQVLDPTYTPIFKDREPEFASGFFAHYNESAHYLIASSLLLAGIALLSSYSLFERISLGFIAGCGLVAIYFTHSRGGILGEVIGLSVLVFGLLIIGQRKKSRWFVPSVIAVPLVLAALVWFLSSGWDASQKSRNIEASGIAQIFDNNSRLYLLGLATSCIGLHPLTGGGSGSFSWECFRFLGGKTQGDLLTRKPEYVHNEIMQAATDYGLIGFILIFVLFGFLVVRAILTLLLDQSSERNSSSEAWYVGGLAALTGMFVQSCFSFNFHLFPGTLLLGICLGMLSRNRILTHESHKKTFTHYLLPTAAVICLIVLVPEGYKSSLLTKSLWSSYCGKSVLLSTDQKIEALTSAIKISPQSTFYQDRASIYQEIALRSGTTEYAEKSAQDYKSAEQLNPHDPISIINQANMHSFLKQDQTAEQLYERAIIVQGGMEPAFRSHFCYSTHLLKKSVRLHDQDQPSKTIPILEFALEQIESAVTKMNWITPEIIPVRVSIHESLGRAYEANGDYNTALKTYDLSAGLDSGLSSNYWAGLLYAKIGRTLWSERKPSEALGYFLEAKRRMFIAGGHFPEGVTAAQSKEQWDYLERTIDYLIGAKIIPQSIK